MKKTLAAVAILGAFAGSALADVSVYGRLDTGVLFTADKVTGTGDVVPADQSWDRNWGMNSGNATTARLGFKGTEKIGEDLTVGFVLESKLTGDTGAGLAGFDREAQVSVSGKYGTLAMGRMGTVVSDAGTYSVFSAAAAWAGTGATNFAGTGLFAAPASRWDNMVTYQSPKMAGVQVTAQYAMGAEGKENTHGTDRYAGIAANYKAGALQLVAAVATVDEAGTEADDFMGVYVGGNYDFEVAKVFAGAQFFKNANDVAGGVAALSSIATAQAGTTVTYSCDNADGYGLTASVSAPVMGGTLAFGATYVKAEGDVEGVVETDLKAFNVGGTYQYPLSKQTSVYAIGGYTQLKADSVMGEGKSQSVKAAVGLFHKF